MITSTIVIKYTVKFHVHGTSKNEIDDNYFILTNQISNSVTEGLFTAYLRNSAHEFDSPYLYKTYTFSVPSFWPPVFVEGDPELARLFENKNDPMWEKIIMPPTKAPVQFYESLSGEEHYNNNMASINLRSVLIVLCSVLLISLCYKAVIRWRRRRKRNRPSVTQGRQNESGLCV
jgi:hypothetical protein